LLGKLRKNSTYLIKNIKQPEKQSLPILDS
jgi:hypothetical protein